MSIHRPPSFQFHKGTIKTLILSTLSTLPGAYFNSIKVRLKLTYKIAYLIRDLFQFHKGTIKTVLACALAVSIYISIP